MGWNILGGFLVFAGAAMGIASFQSGDVVEGVIVAVALAALGVFVIYRHTGNGWVKAQEKKEKAEAAKREKEEKKRMAAERERISVSGLSHIDGLPLTQGTPCTALRKEEMLEIEGGGAVFRVELNRLTDISVKTDVEIQHAYTSSAGGAVAGAMLFGALGAMIGGRTKKKESRTFEYYLIITYLKDGEVSYISFRAPDYRRTERFVALFQGNQNKGETVVDL